MTHSASPDSLGAPQLDDYEEPGFALPMDDEGDQGDRLPIALRTLPSQQHQVATPAAAHPASASSAAVAAPEDDEVGGAWLPSAAVPDAYATSTPRATEGHVFHVREKTPEESARDRAAALAHSIDDDPTAEPTASAATHPAAGALAIAQSLPFVGGFLRHPLAQDALRKLGSNPAAAAAGRASSFASVFSPHEAPLQNAESSDLAFEPMASSEIPFAKRKSTWIGGGFALIVLIWMFGGSSNAPSGPRVSTGSSPAEQRRANATDASGPRQVLTGDMPLPGAAASIVAAPSAAPTSPAPTVQPAPQQAASTPATAVAPEPAPTAKAPLAPPPFFASMTLSPGAGQQAIQAMTAPGAVATPANPTQAAPSRPSVASAPALVGPTAPALVPPPTPESAATQPPAPVPPAASMSAPVVAKPMATHEKAPAPRRAPTHAATQSSSASGATTATGESQADRNAVRTLNDQLTEQLNQRLNAR
ncbi:hypothetical protein LA345_12875 [Burkholderia vietnamiensis]|uniref:Uncharacterized protein n=1 Tax=Burkholderia vietnamiensis (strain G4 / LMG 22486) TaxID=269482 RepID=A4JFJ2_BURVG|nr:conserved hypothetical protein, conserved [Burkholderia vietnamiensis G4]MCB4344805.1 hypothetical protein [Burkholderia vietnamiensis]